MIPLSRISNSNSSEKMLSEYLMNSIKSGVEDKQPQTDETKKGICIKCKGSRLLCGKTRCPLLVRTNYFLKTISLISSKEISGVSPCLLYTSPSPRD